MRLPFLILTPASVLLGLGTAVFSSKQISIAYFILILIGALSAHISVNAFNEYFDFKSGLDFKTERTPFSGGSGTLPAQPGLARLALYTALGAFAVTGLIGLYFIHARGVFILPLGSTWASYRSFLYPLACLPSPSLSGCSGFRFCSYGNRYGTLFLPANTHGRYLWHRWCLSSW